MRSKITTVAIALALVGAFVAPASAAQAASATVSGVVEYHGKPVAGITVGWFKPSTGTYRTAKSGADGSYSLALPGAGQEYVLFGNMNMKGQRQLRVDKKYVGVFYGDGDERDYAFQTLDRYTATSTADELDIELAKPGYIQGREPKLKNSFVRLTTLGGTEVDSHFVEDELVAFQNLVPGDYRIISERKYGFEIPDAIYTVVEGERTSFEPDVITGGKIQGVATGSDGKPAAGVTVTAVPTSEGSEKNETQVDRTDSKGRYLLAHLHDDSYDVIFGYPGDTSDQKTGDRGYVPETDVLTVTETSIITHNVSLAIGGRLRGDFPSTKNSENTLTLVGPDGKVVNEDYNYPVDGKFTLGSLASGKYTAYFTNKVGANFGKKTFTITAGKTVDLGLIKRDKKGYNLSGTIADLDPGLWDGYAGVTATPKASGPSYVAYPDSKGRYSLKGLVPGTYTVSVGALGHDERKYTVTVTANKTKTLAVGVQWGTATARFTVNGAPLGPTFLGFGEYQYYGSTVVDGKWTMAAPAGSYGTDYQFNALFQGKSPNWVEVPEGHFPFTITGGEKNVLGTIALEAH